ncbi:MAG: hypothetical protein ACFFAN_19935, partial [Promethearchaeota archaeon]
MSEEKEKEKWERKEWFVFTQKPKGGGHKAHLRKLASAYGNISIEVDHLSIGNFSLKYSDILKIELSQHYAWSGMRFILIYVIKKITYWVMPSLPLRGTLDVFYPILREKLKQYEQIRISNAIYFIKDLPNLYREINLDDLASRTHLDKVDLM